MATGFGDWTNSVKAHEVFKQIAANEIDRLRPQTRLAEVVSINHEDKSLMARFVGETNEVRIPYTSTAPANSGQWVRVGGTTHDRYVEDVLGETESDRRLGFAEENIDALMVNLLGNEWEDEDPDTLIDRIGNFFENFAGAANFDELRAAFQGEYDGEDFALNTIQTIVGLLRGGLSGLIPMDRIPQITLAQLTNQPGPNLFAGFGDFSAPETISGSEKWTHDPDVGHLEPGSATTTGDGTRKVLTTEEVPVTPGESINISGRVRWEGAVGTGRCMSLVVQPYDDGDQLPEILITSGIVDPPANSGSFVLLQDNWTVPEGMNSVRVRVTVEENLTSGQVWWDDVSFRKTATSLPQKWVNGLIDDLNNLFDWIGSLVDSLLVSLGLPPTGGLFDRITDLADEIGEWLGDTQDQAANLFNLIQDLLTNPAAVIGNLSISKITGLAGELADKASSTIVAQIQNFILSLANAILSGIRRVPIVGGTIADRIEDVIGELTGVVEDQRQIANAVYDGATDREISVVDRTASEVRDSVASLKSRTEAAHLARELENSRALPFWQGLIPGGDVTVPLSTVVIDTMRNVTGTSAGQGFPSHNHGAGSYQVDMAPPASRVFSTVGNSDRLSFHIPWEMGSTQGPIALMRATSDEPRSVVSFMGRLAIDTSSPDAPIVVRVVEYESETGSFVLLSQSDNLVNDIDRTSAQWVHVELPNEINPSIGSILGIQWVSDMHGMSIPCGGLDPAVPSSPGIYPPGAAARVGYFGLGPTMNYQIGDNVLDSPWPEDPSSAPVVEWRSGMIPYAQLAPDLGQTTEPDPRYYFDAFGGHFGLRYFLFTTSAYPYTDGDRWEYRGNTDGEQAIIARQPMSSDRMRVEATMSSAGSSAPAFLVIHAPSKLDIYPVRIGGGLKLVIFPTGNGYLEVGNQERLHNFPVSGNGNGRWGIEYDPSSNTYIIDYEGVVVSTWTDSNYRVRRGSLYRYGGVGSRRHPLSTGGAWDDLLIQDVTD